MLEEIMAELLRFAKTLKAAYQDTQQVQTV